MVNDTVWFFAKFQVGKWADKHIVAYQLGRHYMNLNKYSKLRVAIILISLGVLIYNFGTTLKIRLSTYCDEIITITVILNF